jgi:hypothetical protein
MDTDSKTSEHNKEQSKKLFKMLSNVSKMNEETERIKYVEEQIQAEKKRQRAAIYANNKMTLAKFLKIIYRSFFSRAGILELVVFLAAIVGYNYSKELGFAFLFVALITYPWMLSDYLEKEEASQIIGNPYNLKKIQLFFAKIVLFESMFYSHAGVLFVCLLSWSYVESKAVNSNKDVIYFSNFVAICSFIYILYKYRKKRDEYLH